ncbi:hypothetical protein MMEU_1866 [Mycobacterium marinum str. Europe]|nr:hypothetical protein MMEU_1866 [Mycobacterium marinum str. Europe]
MCKHPPLFSPTMVWWSYGTRGGTMTRAQVARLLEQHQASGRR